MGIMFLMNVILLLLIIPSFPKYIDYVNTLYASGGFLAGMGADPAGVQAPFGMVRLGPDSVNEYNAYVDEEHAGGYLASDKYIRIFSHIHMLGAGCPDYGNIGVMPFGINKFFEHPDYDFHIQDYNYKSSHDIKNTEPGYFNVELTDTKIGVELTSTKYVGLHRYTYHSSEDKPFIFFFISHTITSGACKDSYVEVDVENQEISGWIINAGGLTERIDVVGGVKIYFVAKLNTKFDGYGIWQNDKVENLQTNATGKNVGAYISFSSAQGPIELYVGVSFISIEQAKENMKHDLPSSSSEDDSVFDQTKKDAQNEWESQLSKVKIMKGGTEEQLRTFYSAFYRSLSAPTLFLEANNVYYGFDRSIHTKKEGNYYSDLSIWDVFRSQFPLLTLLSSDVMKDIVQSLVLMYEQGGDIPRWAIANGYTGCMIGQHATVAITDAYLKGITDFDVQTAYKGMKQGATQPQRHAGRQVGDWSAFGFIPSDNISQSVCLTLAYAYDDGILSKMSTILGFKEDADLFHTRSKGYQKVFNSETKLFCPKSSTGKFDCPTDPTDVFDERYIEGDSYHWRYFVPHDVDGMISLFEKAGGTDYFVQQLEEFVKLEFSDPLTWIPNKYFWVGNEHNLLSPWLFNYAKRPDLTQKYIRNVIQYYFNSTPSGCPGNDDFGETSSWLVFASIGFYPNSGQTTYSIGTPIFEHFQFTLGQKPNCVVNVTLENYDQAKNYYIEKIEVNGKEHDTLFFDHVGDFLGNDCPINIVYYMTDTPKL